MCSLFGGSSDTTTTSTTAPSDPTALRAKNAVLGRGLDILNQSYPGYDPSKRVAGFNKDQKAGFKAVRAFANSPSEYTSERIVDENGKLGAISDYIDPYIRNALQPAIRDVQEAGMRQRNDIGSSAIMSGAFGDARHGVAEGQQMQNEDRTIGDLTSTGYSNAFQNAMGQRSGDLDRFNAVASLRDQATLNRALAQLGIGDQKRQRDQSQLDANYQEFLNAREWPFRQFDLLGSILSGTPTAQTTTSTTSQPDNGMWGLLGSLFGSFLGR